MLFKINTDDKNERKHLESLLSLGILEVFSTLNK